ncbi:hypothetical protein GYMLUDRAFT_172092 [Collybiopsis luxurians FD-317 M1]|uniref:Apoptogenic protein 1, mitochondrial n=1 Tax=Collybiopsis luxurians FD-317 M1 TaxID=944289 RepID=A0A0D0BRD8_9AGAR|nr:hypothetical protein GYMLUDRAFT_172092 [Collybiopsis luxurians FD-317 M1]
MPCPSLSSSSVRNSTRLLHASATLSRHLVGPPHPISHLRPVIYDDAPPPPKPTFLTHPYSLQEFHPEPARNSNAYEMQWKLQRQQLDDMSQNFWLDSNTRFEAAKNAVLTSLPDSATPLDKEIALSEFYKQWLLQEKERVDGYARLWRARNWANIIFAARVQYSKFPSRLASLFKSKTPS